VNWEEAGRLCGDPYRFIGGLQIADKRGKLRSMAPFWPEQLDTIAAMLLFDNVFALKSRQRGITTVVLGFFFWLLYCSPDPAHLISVTHALWARGSVNSKLRLFQRRMPEPLPNGFAKDSAEYLQLAHNKAGAVQMVAGGRGQGRSFTFQHQHWTEMAYYPVGSAANASKQHDKAADRQVWASVNSTVESAPGHKTVIESTANGPYGLYYEMHETSRQNPAEWAHLFWPWFYTNDYTRPIRDPHKFVAELRDDERQLLELHGDAGLTLEHLAWRRHRIEVLGYKRELFRLEFPSDENEPFELSGGLWFDADRVREIGARATREGARLCPPGEAYVEIVPPEPGRRYFLGQDTSGGVGKDYASVQVLRDDFTQVARWRSNRVGPRGQAEQSARMSLRYNRGRINCERNKYGHQVIAHLLELGAPMWEDDKGRPGFWTQGGSNTSKRFLFDYAREVIQAGFCAPSVPGVVPVISCPVLAAQLGRVAEGADGNIQVARSAGVKVDDEEDQETHDDDVMAWVLALWCGREQFRGRKVQQFKQPTGFLGELLAKYGATP